MSLSRVLYRVRQFYFALRAAADPRDLEQARSVLTPAQVALFTGMQSSAVRSRRWLWPQRIVRITRTPASKAIALTRRSM